MTKMIHGIGRVKRLRPEQLETTNEKRERLRLLSANDSDPCGWCGTPNNKHSHLYGKEIKKKREYGNHVLICEGPDFPDQEDALLTTKWLMFRCVITTPPPDNPCDSDFMKEISS